MTNNIEPQICIDIEAVLTAAATEMAEITENVWASRDLNQTITLTFAQDGFDGEVNIVSNCNAQLFTQLALHLETPGEWCQGWLEALSSIDSETIRIEHEKLTYTAEIFALLQNNFGEMKPTFDTQNAKQTPLFQVVRRHLINAALYNPDDDPEKVRDTNTETAIDWLKSDESIIERLTLGLMDQFETGKHPIFPDQDNETGDREPIKIEFHAPTGKNQIIVNAVDSNNHTVASLTAHLPVATQMGTMNNQDVRYALFWKLLHHLDPEVASDILDNTSLGLSHKTDALQTETDLSTEDLSTLILNVHRIEIDH